ncbi:hypothetical protein E5Q_03498 [Mixia osmundae IAM 14324]|uniref:Uncharacterized protein n=1 Tax=Mixia osmundae (strain CBS 9802 / IAM 14324 / JCM 22182 / KY 12970) TaxID=764103 RepID=G7E1Y9_MIXOS|nr:hypothetical protein E5Q_03498 [Mixia osmundae IAM 14324]
MGFTDAPGVSVSSKAADDDDAMLIVEWTVRPQEAIAMSVTIALYRSSAHRADALEDGIEQWGHDQLSFICGPPRSLLGVDCSHLILASRMRDDVHFPRS